MVNIEAKSTGDIWLCLLIFGFTHVLAFLERFKEILGGVWALFHRQDVVGCHVFQHASTCVVSVSNKIELSAELIGLDVGILRAYVICCRRRSVAQTLRLQLLLEEVMTADRRPDEIEVDRLDQQLATAEPGDMNALTKAVATEDLSLAHWAAADIEAGTV